MEKTCPENEHEHTRSFIPSLMAEEGQRLGLAVREHWSVENKNHHKRDRHVGRKTATVTGGSDITQSLALARKAPLAVILFDEKTSLPALIVEYQDRKQPGIDLILRAKPLP